MLRVNNTGHTQPILFYNYFGIALYSENFPANGNYTS